MKVINVCIACITSFFQYWKLSSMVTLSKWLAYNIAYKLKVVWFTKEHGNRAAERLVGSSLTEKIFWTVEKTIKRNQEKLVTGWSTIYIKHIYLFFLEFFFFQNQGLSSEMQCLISLKIWYVVLYLILFSNLEKCNQPNHLSRVKTVSLLHGLLCLKLNYVTLCILWVAYPLLSHSLHATLAAETTII